MLNNNKIGDENYKIDNYFCPRCGGQMYEVDSWRDCDGLNIGAACENNKNGTCGYTNIYTPTC